MTTNTRTYLTSPNYPSYYPKSAKCTWFFTATDDGTYVIQYNDLNTEYYDYLTVGKTHDVNEENVVNRMSLWFSPNTVRLRHRLMWVRFTTNNDTWLDKGFFVQVERLGPNQGKIPTYMEHLTRCIGFERLSNDGRHP